jgi:hypothetical protein
MLYNFSKDANGAKIEYPNGLIRSNQPVVIGPGDAASLISITMGGVRLQVPLNEIGTIDGAAAATTVPAVIEQLIPVFPNALAQVGQTAAGAVQKAGDTMTGMLKILINSQGKKAILAMKDPGSQNDAPTTLGAASTYLQIGAGEWNTNSFRLIALGYIAADGNHAPAFIGYQEISITSNTRGDLIFGTRPNNNNVAPSIIFRIRENGQVELENAAYAPGSDKSIVNRKFVNDSLATKLTASFGDTASRPAALTAANTGQQYFDTTLIKPIWWSGTAWVDATGANV